jgi:hypothetical protein
MKGLIGFLILLSIAAACTPRIRPKFEVLSDEYGIGLCKEVSVKEGKIRAVCEFEM